ncbi:MAG: DUF2569 domain-containing protein [Betaproteobacteria bacterium]|nr:DUF2569 domain-containing protein [Betaproteobacteria bacterium]
MDREKIMSTNPYQPPKSRLEDAEGAELKGLGGWLILVAFGLIATMGSLFAGVGFLVFFAQDLPIPGLETFTRPQLAFEIVGSLGLAGLAGVSLYFFFTKSRRFPRFFIGYALFGLLLAIGNFFVYRAIPAASVNGAVALAKQLLYSVIWIAYMQRSKRVRNTFVE